MIFKKEQNNMTRTKLYTRSGSEVIPLSFDDPWLTVKRVEDGEIREWHINDFRSDGGLVAILKIVEKLPKTATASREEQKT